MYLATVSWLDVVLVVLLVSSIAFGFHQGLLRQAFLLVAMYVAAILSARYCTLLTSILFDMFPSSLEMARLIAFLIMMAVITAAVTSLIWNAYCQTRLPSVLMADEVGGSILGGVIGIFAISLTLMLARYALAAPWPESNPVRDYLYVGLRDSSLQAVFTSPLPLIQLALLPWLPSGIPVVLNG